MPWPEPKTIPQDLWGCVEMLRSRIEASNAIKRLALEEEKDFAPVTLHRPSNVDDSKVLSGLCLTLSRISTFP